jgi:type IV pilus assembly protein PilM
MQQLFKAKEKFSVGLDMGTLAIKAVKLKLVKDKVSLMDVAIEEARAGLGVAIKKISESLDIKNVNISVSGPLTILRYVIFPKMKKEELGQALKFEAPQYIPFPIEELNLDSCILKDSLPDNKMLVLLAGVKKEFLKERLKIIGDLGLKVNLIDIDSLALVNAFDFNYPQLTGAAHKAISLLNIGASTTNLNILEEGVVALSRDINIAGNNFTQVEPAVANLAKEIRSSFDYYESQAATSVTKIFLSGGGSLLAGLKDMLANLLGQEVEYWDPLARIGVSEGGVSEKIKTISSQLAVAVGLALR